MAVSYLLSQGVLDTLLPRPFVATADWATANIKMPPDSKIRGGFRLDMFPHIRGIFAALDDPKIRRVTIQSAAQVGKTTIAQAYVAKVAATNPHPMVWADADVSTIERVIGRTWRMFEKTKGLAHLCPPSARQSSHCIKTSTFVINTAYPRSPSSAADIPAFVVVKNEADKMKGVSTSSEADFRDLIDERVKGYHGWKIIEISTPTLKGQSYIESQRLKGSNCAWMVPCPHCQHHQPLKTGDGKTPGGIRFEKKDGVLDADHAEATAYYECEACRGRIDEHQRYDMLQRGVWVPEGCGVDKQGNLIGTPKRSGEHASFGPIPTLASLLPSITIGTVARKLVEAMTAPASERVEKLRNFRNSWEGETFDPRPKTIQVHELQTRLSLDIAPRICPEWSRFLTVGVDTGSINQELIFYWLVSSWTRINVSGKLWGKRGHCVDHGVTYGEKQFREQIAFWISTGYPHADGGTNLTARRIGIDSGAGTQANRVYTFCESFPRCVWPLKGSSHDLGIEFYDIGFQRVDVPTKELAARRKMGLGDLFYVNTQRTQGWRMDLTSGVMQRDSPEWYSIPAEFASDHEFLDELIADFPVETENSVRWDRSGPNEKGDALRYSFALANHFGGQDWLNLPQRTAKKPRSSDATRRANVRSTSRNHSRPFMPSDR